jgi:uncharacterized protein YgbK (DUF1537 family)
MKSGSPVRAIVVADDLTGACDAGAAFACSGLRTEISFASDFSPDAEILVVSTDSRRLSGQSAFDCVGRWARSLPLAEAAIVFKKIDSTLRGNLLMECEALRLAAQCSRAVLAPALPTQGRTVRDGILHVSDLAGSWSAAIDELWRRQGGDLAATRIDALADALRDDMTSSPYMLCDAESDEDLARIAKILYASRARVLWIGSTGLAKQAAHCLVGNSDSARLPGTPDPPDADDRPVLCVLGSDHPVTQRQLELLLEERPCKQIAVEDCTSYDLDAACAGDRSLLLMVDMRKPEVEPLRRLLERIPRDAFAGIFLSGGDTATLVCRAAQVRQIRLEGQLQPGVAVGQLRGGPLSGTRVVTKSGGFGTERCILESHDFLAAQGARGRTLTP